MSKIDIASLDVSDAVVVGVTRIANSKRFVRLAELNVGFTQAVSVFQTRRVLLSLCLLMNELKAREVKQRGSGNGGGNGKG